MRRAARILLHLVTAISALVMLTTIALWERGQHVGDLFLLRVCDGEQDATPGSWMVGLASGDGGLTIDCSFGMQTTIRWMRSYYPRTPATWGRFYFDHDHGYTVLRLPYWFVVLLSAPLPLWWSWRWVRAPKRSDTRGFDVSVDSPPT